MPQTVAEQRGVEWRRPIGEVRVGNDVASITASELDGERTVTVSAYDCASRRDPSSVIVRGQALVEFSNVPHHLAPLLTAVGGLTMNSKRLSEQRDSAVRRIGCLIFVVAIVAIVAIVAMWAYCKYG